MWCRSQSTLLASAHMHVGWNTKHTFGCVGSVCVCFNEKARKKSIRLVLNVMTFLCTYTFIRHLFQTPSISQTLTPITELFANIFQPSRKMFENHMASWKKNKPSGSHTKLTGVTRALPHTRSFRCTREAWKGNNVIGKGEWARVKVREKSKSQPNQST